MKVKAQSPHIVVKRLRLCYNGELTQAFLHAWLFPGSAGSAGSAILGTWGRDFIILK